MKILVTGGCGYIGSHTCVELLNEGYTELVTACLNGNPSNEFHKSLGGILVEQSEFEPLGIHVGTENVYFHKNLRKSLEYNSSKKI